MSKMSKIGKKERKERKNVVYRKGTTSSASISKGTGYSAAGTGYSAAGTGYSAAVPKFKPDFYPSLASLRQSGSVRINTNPRYSNFCQTHPTAGDYQQFVEWYEDGHRPEDPDEKKEFPPSPSLIPSTPIYIWHKFTDINAEAVMNTFRYMFHKFKKGIYIRIRKNRVTAFIPFSKKNFVNEWSDHIHIHPKYQGRMENFVAHINDISERKYYGKVDKYPSHWYANNHLLRYEYPTAEGDTNVSNMKNMFEELCRCKVIPDIELYINRRDMPMIKRDGTEAYNHLFDSSTHPLVSHNYEKYCPILSMVSNSSFADIAIPTGDDWARVCIPEGKFFQHSRTECYTPPSSSEDEEIGERGERGDILNWSDKIPTAVFRGSSTGAGVTPETNVRLKAAMMSVNQPPSSPSSPPLLDVGITKWNLRPRKIEGERYLRTIDIRCLPFGLSNYISISEQARYKYILHLPGHTSAFRLSQELGMGCCVLFVDCGYYLWFQKWLKEGVHYLTVKEDLSNLFEVVQWCREHDEECQQIAKNALEFYNKYLRKDGILNYLQNTLIQLKSAMGNYSYPSTTPLDALIHREKGLLTYAYPRVRGTTPFTSILHVRNYSTLRSIEWLVRWKIEQGESISSSSSIFSSKISKVEETKINGVEVIIKTAHTHHKRREAVHESFVGVKCLNYLLPHIPNFMYIYALDKKDRVIAEKIRGQSLHQYIQSSSFNFSTFTFLLLQISLAIHTAYRKYHFVHSDLAPWNVMVHPLSSPQTYEYHLLLSEEEGEEKEGEVYYVTTDVIPIIIDYGKSYIVYGDGKTTSDVKEYGFLHSLGMVKEELTNVEDVFRLLVSSICCLLQKEIDPASCMIDGLLYLANFVSGTTFHPHRFRRAGKNGLGEVKYFFNSISNYEAIIYTDKNKLEDKNTVAFIRYLLARWTFDGRVERGERRRSSARVVYKDTSNPRQIFDYIFSTNDIQRVLSFVRVFQRVDKYLGERGGRGGRGGRDIGVDDAKEIYDSLKNVKKEFQAFLQREDIEYTDDDEFINIVLTKVKRLSEREIIKR